MAEDITAGVLHRIAGESHGVRVMLSVDSRDLLKRLREILPPDWRSTEPSGADSHFSLTTTDGLEYLLTRDDLVLTSAELDVALGVFDAQLRSYIALHAPGRIFVHAGVVASGGRAIVIPGPSFSGKTTLVAALVRAGAEYYSDEYAVLDERGLVSPYAKPLSIRTVGRLSNDQHVSTLGGVAGERPVPVRLIVVARFRLGAAWKPRELSPGDAALAVLVNTIPFTERPAESLAAIRVTVTSATTLEGERGEADSLAEVLLERVAR